MNAMLFTRLKTALVNVVFIASTPALLLPAADRYTFGQRRAEASQPDDAVGRGSLIFCHAFLLIQW